MSKNTRDNIAALIFLMSAIVAIVTFQYSNIVNVPLDLAIDSLQIALLALVGGYLVLGALNRSNKPMKSLILAVIFGSRPVFEFHWVAFLEYATFIDIGLCIAATYIVFFWGE